MSSGTASRYSGNGIALTSRLTKTSPSHVSTRAATSGKSDIRSEPKPLRLGPPLEYAGQVPGPAVITALEFAQPRTRAHTQRIAAMTAGILERTQHAIVTADDQHTIWAATVFEEVAGLRDMVEHARDLPHFRPHPLDLECGERRRVIPF